MHKIAINEKLTLNVYLKKSFDSISFKKIKKYP